MKGKRRYEENKSDEECVRSSVRQAGSKIISKLVAQINSKITARCHTMQPIKNRRVPSMLAAGANWKLAHERFFRKIDLCEPNGFFYSNTFFSLFYHRSHHHFKGLALFNKLFKLFNVSALCVTR